MESMTGMMLSPKAHILKIRLVELFPYLLDNFRRTPQDRHRKFDDAKMLVAALVGNVSPYHFDFKLELTRFANPVYLFNILFLGLGASALYIGGHCVGECDIFQQVVKAYTTQARSDKGQFLLPGRPLQAPGINAPGLYLLKGCYAVQLPGKYSYRQGQKTVGARRSPR